MKFIDLFAGLGGFHKALSELGHECVFASESNLVLQDLYEKNWGIRPHGDIRSVTTSNLESIPPHDILCAGFPCQPFSKAGKQLGKKDVVRGTLFDEIILILNYHKPKFFILENVPFIAKHDNEETWKLMKSQLSIDYDVDHNFYSPHQFGIPQHRQRMFIVGGRKEFGGLGDFSFMAVDKHKVESESSNVKDFVDTNPQVLKSLPSANQRCISIWQSILDAIPKESIVPKFPIWAMEFGADYPFEGVIPRKLSAEVLGNYKGNFGKPLYGLTFEEQMANLPSYARVDDFFPDWKVKWIRQNRDFYNNNVQFIGPFVEELSTFPSQSWQKLEWNVAGSSRRILDFVLQFRASGIRVKELNYFPSLVCVSTQIPIIGWQNRYMTRNEGLRLQGLEGIQLPAIDNAAFQALGNAVNAKIVGFIAACLLRSEFSVLTSLREEHEICQ